MDILILNMNIINGYTNTPVVVYRYMLVPFLQYHYLDGLRYGRPTMILEEGIRPESSELRNLCHQILLSGER
jgi:hypothetical protein